MNGLYGHEVEGVLREVPGARRVLRTRVHGAQCVTRVLLGARVGPELGPLIERVALQGRGSLAGVPEDLLLTLEGYKVAARLPQPDARWPQALAAGVTPDGLVFVTTRWIEGAPLDPAALPADRARDVAVAVAGILCELHAHHVVHGDLKPENLVLGPDGDVAIIDLDTLREVGGASLFAITRDITRSWAAPEQAGQQRTYLASDLWCWARLVERLFPGGAPAEWALALSACRHPDPLRRPHTARLLAHLHDVSEPLLDWQDRPVEPAPDAPSIPTAPSVATERVPDAASTERVPDATGPTPSPRAAAPPAPRKRRFGCLHVFGGMVLTPIVLCAGVATWWDRANAAEADRLAAETMVAIKAHKTSRELNSEAQRDKLREQAETAWQTHHTRRSGAVRALAVVWAQGWQDSRRAWNAERWAEGLAAVQDAEGRREEAEVLLAEGTLYAASCRLRREEASAAADCDHALSALEDVYALLPAGDDHHWLRVEAAWTEVLVRGEIARRQLGERLPEGATTVEAARARCQEAETWLPWAPVNGPELMQDCLRIQALAGDWPGYLHVADLLLDADRQDGELGKSTLWHLYAAAGDGCDAVSLDRRRGEWHVKGPLWCLAAGNGARGCWAGAAWAAERGRVESPDLPWDTLLALGDGTDTACVR